MDHMTARVSCFARAYHYKNNQTAIFSDTAAEALLGADYDEVARNMADGVRFFLPEFEGTREEGLRLIVDRQLSPSVLARSAYCESRLSDAIKNGCRQYLVFASGYDTFSIRNTAADVSVYELDIPEMIADKTARMKRAGLRSDARYVPCDLSKDTWAEALTAAGYHTEQSSFSSLLGISYYLTTAEFEKLLTRMHEVLADASVVCFDYPSVEESDETKRNQVLASGAGEQMKAVYSYADLQALLKKSGFEPVELVNHAEITKRFFEAYNRKNPAHPMQAPSGVGYVTAMKVSGGAADEKW